MNKSFLIVDKMPDNCICCLYNYDMYQCINTGNSTLNLESYDKRPDWCPIKEFPECDDFYSNDDFDIGVKYGWKQCIATMIDLGTY